MSIGELVIIGIIILLVVPPEKLPGLARDFGRFLNDIRRNTSGVWEELKKDVPNPVEELKKQKQEAEEYMKFIGSDGHSHGHETDHHGSDIPKPMDQSHMQSEVSEPHPTIHTAPPTITSTDASPEKPEDKKPKIES